jgi:hypothetical protein
LRIAPAVPGVVHVCLVLRDSRGGVDFAAYAMRHPPVKERRGSTSSRAPAVFRRNHLFVTWL